MMKIDDDETRTLDDGANDGARPPEMVGPNRAIGWFAVWSLLAAASLTACGGEGGGNEDTLFTGLSGVIILGAVIWFVVRKAKSRD